MTTKPVSARLLEAAPDLLAAAHAFDAAYDLATQYPVASLEDDRALKAAVHMARAAIRKANGDDK